MADKNPVRGMQPMDDYEEMMYRRTPEGKREMEVGAMKAIGAPAAVIAGGATVANAIDAYRGKKKREEELKAEAKKSSEEMAIENAKQAARNKREAEGAEKEVKRNMSTFGFKKGGKVSSASSRADGIAQRGKTRGKIC